MWTHSSRYQGPMDSQIFLGSKCWMNQQQGNPIQQVHLCTCHTLLVVTMNLSYASRDIKSKPVQVNSIENADKNGKKIQKWIDDIRELHKSKPAPTVNYSKPMPDINKLMQTWPDQFEELLQTVHYSRELTKLD